MKAKVVTLVADAISPVFENRVVKTILLVLEVLASIAFVGFLALLFVAAIFGLAGAWLSMDLYNDYSFWVIAQAVISAVIILAGMFWIISTQD